MEGRVDSPAIDFDGHPILLEVLVLVARQKGYAVSRHESGWFEVWRDEQVASLQMGFPVRTETYDVEEAQV